MSKRHDLDVDEADARKQKKKSERRYETELAKKHMWTAPSLQEFL